jgi:hypothetical protein
MSTESQSSQRRRWPIALVLTLLLAALVVVLLVVLLTLDSGSATALGATAGFGEPIASPVLSGGAA